MKLIPEQIINLRKKLINQDNFIYKEYIDDIKNNKADDMFKIAYHDYSTENMMNLSKTRINDADKLLKNSECIEERNIDSIDIGTRFIIYDEEFDETEEYTLVETLEGLTTLNGFVSTSSPMGSAVLGKKENEIVEYEGPVGKIKLKVESIESNPDNYIKPLRNNSNYSIEEIEDYQEITPSQRYLLYLELSKLEKQISNKNLNELKSRYEEIKQLLSREVLNGTEDDTIGIGSRFSLHIKDHEREYDLEDIEMINRAYSNEYEGEYIERISSLGSQLFGLKENEEFTTKINNKNVVGYVYNIENCIKKPNTLTK